MESRAAERGGVSKEELKQEDGEEIIDRETTSFVNAQNIIEDLEEKRREKGEKDD